MFGDSSYYPHASRRQVIYGTQGMVATSQPLAAQAGLHILRMGGNAIDAAVATAACLTVVEPTCNGIGGDAFAQVWTGDKLHGLNSSGRSPRLLTLDCVHKVDSIPYDGVLPITVPGIPAAWAALNERFGCLSLEQCLEPAINYARYGFAVSVTTAALWQAAHEHYSKSTAQGLDNWFSTFVPSGRAPQAGEIWALPEQADTLIRIAQSKAQDFYKGSIAEKIDAFMCAQGGFLRGEDLHDFSPQWVTPIKVNYRGYDIWEIPPNGHGLVCLMALNILSNFDMSVTDSPETLHKLIEAVKLAFIDGLAHIADPRYMKVSVEQLLKASFGEQRAASIGAQALDPIPVTPPQGGTVYLATADGHGNMVSYIQSNYTGFGSGMVVPGTGIALQNRGACFSTDPQHPNCVGPDKHSYHTIIPGFVTKNDKPLGPFGMMGGFIQPQGHVMLMHRCLDNGLNPQAALDAPRFRWVRGKEVEVEASFPAHLAEALRRKGHRIKYGAVGDNDFGRGQIIWQLGDNPLRFAGGTEPRTDGHVAAF